MPLIKIHGWLLIIVLLAANGALAANGHYYYLTGVIEEAEPRGGRWYLVITPTQLNPAKSFYGKPTPTITPRKIRVTASKNKYPDLLPGNQLQSLVNLSPPKPPLAPGSFDWGEYLAERGIDATGFIAGKITMLPAAEPSIKQRLQAWRLQTAAALYEAAPNENTGAFAAALLTGVRGYLPKPTINNMRDAGLAHLLAISGMHMAMVTGMVFLLIRRLLAFSYRVDGKRVAAIIALFVAFGYLLLAGASVSTQRAFVMTASVLIAVLLNRQALSLWSLGVAGSVVLLISPAALLGPGFQLSFAAAGVLILYYRQQKDKPDDTYMASYPTKLWRYALAIVMSTLLINLVTAPVAAFHFQKVTSYGVLGNLVAIPLTGTLIMPLLLMALLLLPLGLANLPLWLVQWPLALLAGTAGELAELPKAVWHLPPIPGALAAVFAIGVLWLWFGHRYRWIGLLPVLITSYGIWNTPQPVYIITHDAKMLGKLHDDHIEAIGWQPSRFVADKWAEYYGKTRYEKRKCPDDPCQLDNFIVAGIYDAVDIACDLAKDHPDIIVITRLKTPRHCPTIRPDNQAIALYPIKGASNNGLNAWHLRTTPLPLLSSFTGTVE